MLGNQKVTDQALPCDNLSEYSEISLIKGVHSIYFTTHHKAELC
jgi:hypothetical protein